MGGADEFGFRAVVGTLGFTLGGLNRIASFRLPNARAAGGFVGGVFGLPATPERFRGATDGSVVVCGASLGLATLDPAVRGGTGGAPFIPGTGNAFAFGNAKFCGSALGDTLLGILGAAF